MRDNIPANVEAEEGLLGAVLMDGKIFPDIEGLLIASDLWRDSHQLIFDVFLHLSAKNEPIDIISVANELERRGELDRVGHYEALDHLKDRVVHTENARYHAGIVREKSIARKVMEVCGVFAAKGRENSMKADDYLAEAESQILKIGDMRSNTTTYRISDLMRQAAERIDRRGRNELQGISTGFIDYDAITDGMQPGQLIVVAGRPGMGKSSLGLNIAEHVTFNDGGAALFCTLEMGGMELAERSIASRTRIAGPVLRRGKLSNAEWAAVADLIDRSDDVDLTIDAAPGRTIAQICSLARRHKSRSRLDLLLVDYLQLLIPTDSDDSRQEQVSEISRRLKILTGELQIPIIAMAQLNRKSESREDRKPMLSDLRESGAIEQDADVVLLLHRADYYNPTAEPGKAEMIVAKNRNGETKTIPLTFCKELMRYENHCKA